MAPHDTRNGANSGSGAASPHIPVMLAEVLEALQPRDGGRYIDMTFGAGGYARAILDAAECELQAFDRDPSAGVAGFPMVMEYGGRFRLATARFSKLNHWADLDPEIWAGQFDGVVFDLGVSSMQLDQPERGFSFQSDGPLDMRMGAADGTTMPGDGERTAADLVNTLEADDLADILFHYGEERRSRAIARAILKARETAPIATTKALAEIVISVLGRRPHDKVHPATRTFQALRIAVNLELDELIEGLAGAEKVLKPGGRLVVVTFHSLEDRIVKRFMAERAGKLEAVSRHVPESQQLQRPSLELVYQRPLAPGNEETLVNPRARSAKLRCAQRLDAPVWPLNPRKLGVPVLGRT